MLFRHAYAKTPRMLGSSRQAESRKAQGEVVAVTLTPTMLRELRSLARRRRSTLLATAQALLIQQIQRVRVGRP